jgi:hypothetical protein
VADSVIPFHIEVTRRHVWTDGDEAANVPCA